MSFYKKVSDKDIFLSEWALPGHLSIFVERWEGPDAYYDIHRATGYYRKTEGKEGLLPFGEWKQDASVIAKFK